MTDRGICYVSLLALALGASTTGTCPERDREALRRAVERLTDEDSALLAPILQYAGIMADAFEDFADDLGL